MGKTGTNYGSPLEHQEHPKLPPQRYKLPPIIKYMSSEEYRQQSEESYSPPPQITTYHHHCEPNPIHL